jgi:hypothetical protein
VIQLLVSYASVLRPRFAVGALSLEPTAPRRQNVKT